MEECCLKVLNEKMEKTLKLTPIDSGNFKIDSELTPADPELTPIDSELTPADSGAIFDKRKTLKKFICEYCNAQLSKNSHLHRHYRRCKIKKIHDEKILRLELLKQQEEKEKREMKNEIDRLIQENSQLHDRLSEAISKAGNNNNNIVLLNFGNERLDHLDIGKIGTSLKKRVHMVLCLKYSLIYI